MRWDPEEWSRTYEPERRSGQAFVFRHGAELARRACLARASPGGHWADVGCGTGQLASLLAEAGLDVVGVDIDPEMIRFARRRFQPPPEPGRLRFKIAEAARLPFSDGALEGMVATSLMGLLDDAGAFLREVHRVVRPGGTAVITFTNRTSALHAIRARARAPRGTPPPTHAPVRPYSAAEALGELERSGLVGTEVRPYNFFLSTAGHMFPPPAAALAIERFLRGRTAALVARNLLVVAERR